MHMQSYSTTADSEHSTITSLYPMENGMSFSKYYTNTVVTKSFSRGRRKHPFTKKNYKGL